MEQLSIPDPPGFGDLSKVEQIRYLQALWDRISENPDDIPVLESHLKLAEQRLADYRRNPKKARPAYQVLDRLRKKTKWAAIDSFPSPVRILMSRRPSNGTRVSNLG